jgi:hypothetical protein
MKLADGICASEGSEGVAMAGETLTVRQEGAVLFADIAAPPMNLLGPELVRDLVSLIQRTEASDAVRVREGEMALARMVGDLAD